MYFSFIDESGGTEAPASNSAATPLMVIAGLIINAAAIPSITTEYLKTKRRYFPQKCHSSRQLDHILVEVKGSDIRASLRSGSRNTRRHRLGYIDKVMDLLVQHQVQIVGRVWIKAIGASLDPRPSYTYAIQDIAHHFEHFLDAKNDVGVIVADSRMHNQNSEVSHSIFTQKHAQVGDKLPHILEAPAFGSSQNHAMLQLADTVASALLFPIAARVYCSHQWTGVHTNPRFEELRTRYSSRLSALQYRYQSGNGWQGGVVVSDRLRQFPSSRLFQFP